MYVFLGPVLIAVIVLIKLMNSEKLRTHIAYKCQYCDCLALLA